jgi:heme a synthase
MKKFLDFSIKKYQKIKFKRSFSNEVNLNPPKTVKYWLLGTSTLVVSIILVGGLTRLEEAGLSMTDWKPLGGLPPTSEEKWEKEFEIYKKFPEYDKKNRGMSLEEFKYIYWYEYSHRMLGRLIGIIKNK